MLTKCPECGLQVSNLAFTCPHCGYPLKDKPKYKRQAPHKRRRLPNGFGQISEIKGRNLRKPFRAMVTIGHNENGRPICKPLKPESYFKTYNEAYQALIDFNKNPFDITAHCTFNDLYEAWLKTFKASGKSKCTLIHYNTAYNKCKNLHSTKFSAIKRKDIEYIMENECSTDNSKRMVYDLFNKLYSYAIKNGICTLNACTSIPYPVRVDNPKAHITFTSEEMDVLWKHRGDFITDCVLFGCYSGWRPDEMLDIRIKDVDFDKRCITGGNKNKASKGRLVPMHSKVIPIIKNFYEISKQTNSEYLISIDGKRVIYRWYLEKFHRMCKNYGLDMKHRPHDCRVRFITEAKYNNVDEYAIKRIVGHSIPDITERVYSKRGIDWLLSEIEKIK